MKITNEEQLLEQATRAKILKSFEDVANVQRKADAFKGYECLHDKTVNYVLELLLKQFDLSTVQEMQYALSNISILRKIIDKLAKVYANGVKRSMPTSEATSAVEDAAKFFKMNEAMKKTNRYYRVFKNTLVYVKPVKEGEKYTLCVEALPPFHYDAVENPDNPKEALAIIISDFAPARKTLYALGDAAVANRGAIRESHVVNAPVQQTPETGIVRNATGSTDEGRRFIWWSKNYHFTTDAKGAIIPELSDGVENPIKKLPFVNLAADQDGKFFAEGGYDLIDAGVQINVALTNLKHVGYSQGFGQLYMTGKNLPKSVKVGVNYCVQLEQATEQHIHRECFY